MTIYITRGLGKSYEEKMYKELGGMPTTIIFRFDDNIIADISLGRYSKLHFRVDGFDGAVNPRNQCINIGGTPIR